MKRWQAALVVPILAAAIGVTGCSNTNASYYQVADFASMDNDKIIEELEENQNLSYETQGDEIYAWSGAPKDAICDEAADTDVVICKEGKISWTAASRDDLRSGVEVEGMQIVFASDAYNNGSMKSLADDIAKKCELKNVEGEGYEAPGSWVRIGSCKIDGKDAYWLIRFLDGGYCMIETHQSDDMTAKDMAEHLKEDDSISNWR